MPAADIFVVLCHSLARPKSVIFKVFLPMSSFSIFSSNKTEKRGEREDALEWDPVRDWEWYEKKKLDKETTERAKQVMRD